MSNDNGSGSFVKPFTTDKNISTSNENLAGLTETYYNLLSLNKIDIGLQNIYFEKNNIIKMIKDYITPINPNKI